MNHLPVSLKLHDGPIFDGTKINTIANISPLPALLKQSCLPCFFRIYMLSYFLESNSNTISLIKPKKLLEPYKRFAVNSWCISESVASVRKQEHTKANVEGERRNLENHVLDTFSKHYRCRLAFL